MSNIEQMYSQEQLNDLTKFEVELYLKYKKYFDSNYLMFRTMLEILEKDKERLKLDDDVKRAISYLFVTCFKTYTSILVLCKKGFAPAAGMLTRSLFENIIDMKWILNKDREERARKFLNYSTVIKKSLYEKWEQHGIIEIIQLKLLDRMDSVESVQKAYAEVKQDYPNERYWSGKNRRQQAEEQGVNMAYDYDFYYWFFSLLTHSTIAGKVTSTTVEGNTESVFYGPSFSPEIMDDILERSYEYILRAFIELNQVFNLNEGNNVKKFYEGLKVLSVKRNKGL